MSHTPRVPLTLLGILLAASVFSAQAPPAQPPPPAAAAPLPTGPPTNDGPNPYETVANFFKMPEGRTWGATSAVEIDKDGKSIWVGERCGANLCLDRATGQMSPLPSILKFDDTGKLVTSFGAGMLVFPHGIHVDRDGNVWVTDGQDNAPQPARGTGPGGAAGAPPAGGAAGQGRGRGGPPRMGPLPGATIGHNVYKFSPGGKLLMTLGKPGGAAEEPEYFYQPNDLVTAPNGDIFVAEGHGGGNSRILKFSKDGKLIKTIGKKGTAPGEFDQPHALAMDSKGRLFVGDRGNNRIQILDQDGTFIEIWTQYGRPSGLYIDKQDNLYVADSESGSVNPPMSAWRRGIRVGRIADGKNGKLIAFIPDPDTRTRADTPTPPFIGTSAAEGVAVDAKGNVYGAEVGPRGLKKYVKK